MPFPAVDLLPVVRQRVALEQEDEEEADGDGADDGKVGPDDPPVDARVGQAQEEHADRGADREGYGCVEHHAEVPRPQGPGGLVEGVAEREVLPGGAVGGAIEGDDAVGQVSGLLNRALGCVRGKSNMILALNGHGHLPWLRI